jgi:hypothetical protein
LRGCSIITSPYFYDNVRWKPGSFSDEVFKTGNKEKEEAKLSGTGQIQLKMVPIRRTCFCYSIEFFLSRKKRKVLRCDNLKDLNGISLFEQERATVYITPRHIYPLFHPLNFPLLVCPVKSISDRLKINPNVAKIPYRRVGCAHQIPLISSVKGGQSPPYTNNTGINHL